LRIKDPGYNHADLEQAALERPVEQRRLAARLETEQFGQAQVGGEEETIPAGPVSFQCRAELRVERRQFVSSPIPLAVGRIGDHDAMIGQRLGFQQIGRSTVTMPPKPASCRLRRVARTAFSSIS
jgi:hypothetical protein